ncbi:MAG: YCF48-related protein [candidate division WOR-3 bacterium]
MVFILLLSLINYPVYHGVACAKGTPYVWMCEKESAYVYKSINYGRSFLEPQNFTYRYLFDIFALDSLNLWLCGEAGYIWHSLDGGESWYPQNFGGSKFATRIFFLDENYGWAACGEAIILLTTNGGEEWQQIILPNPPFPAREVDFYGVHFVNENIGYLCAGRYPEGDSFLKGQGYIAKTTDGGYNWQLLLKDTIYDFFDLYFLDENRGYVVGGCDTNFSAIVLYTSDGGNSWQYINVPGNYLRAITVINNKIFACGMFGTIIYSLDGIDWRLAQTPPGCSTLFDIDFSDSLNGCAVGTRYVLYTNNGGRNWYFSNIGIQENKSFNIKNLPKNKYIYNPLGQKANLTKKGIYFYLQDKKIVKFFSK